MKYITRTKEQTRLRQYKRSQDDVWCGNAGGIGSRYAVYVGHIYQHNTESRPLPLADENSQRKETPYTNNKLFEQGRRVTRTRLFDDIIHDKP